MSDIQESENSQPTQEEINESSIEQVNVGLIDFSDMFIGSFKEVLKRPGLVGSVFLAFASITLIVVVIVFFGLGSFYNDFSNGQLDLQDQILLMSASLLLYIIVVIAYVVASTALLRCAINRREDVKYIDGLNWSVQNIWPIIVIGLYVQLSVMTGYLLLVIPGIVLGIYTAYSLFVFVSEGKDGFGALLRSIDLVHGRLWGILWRALAFSIALGFSILIPLLIVIGVINLALPQVLFLAVIVSVAAYFFAIVWVVFGFTMLFESAQNCKPSSQFDPEKYKLMRKILIVAVIVGIPIFLAWNGYSIYDEITNQVQYDEGVDPFTQFDIFEVE